MVTLVAEERYDCSGGTPSSDIWGSFKKVV